MTQTIATIVPGTVANIDKTGPKITSITAEASETETSVTVTLKAQDQESGITQIDWEYKKDSDSWVKQTDYPEGTPSSIEGTGSKNTSFSHQFTNLEEGTIYIFRATVTNTAGDYETTAEDAEATTIEKGITPTIDNIGDYVNYPIDINGNDETTDDWRIFYVGQKGDGQANGRIFLIAADYVSYRCDELEGPIVYSGMSYANDGKHIAFYWEHSPSYDCYDGHNTNLNKGSPQCSFPDLFMPANKYCDDAYRYLCSDHTDQGSSNCASALQCTTNWEEFAKGNYADYAIGGPTLNMWVESWNAKHGDESGLYANGRDSNYGYYVGTNASTTNYYQDLSSCTSGYGDTLYFPHKSDQLDFDGDGDLDSCFGYWLASPSAFPAGYLMDVTCEGEVAFHWFDKEHIIGVRPVVCLNTTAKLKDGGLNSTRFKRI